MTTYITSCVAVAHSVRCTTQFCLIFSLLTESSCVFSFPPRWSESESCWYQMMFGSQRCWNSSVCSVAMNVLLQEMWMTGCKTVTNSNWTGTQTVSCTLTRSILIILYQKLTLTSHWCVQEARTLKSNNVLNGKWHGRGDILVIGSQVLFTPAGTTQLSPAALQKFSPLRKLLTKVDKPLAVNASTSDPEAGHSWSSHTVHQQSLPLLQH